jgi:hypothetical protein
VSAFPETDPRTWHRAIADTTYPTGTLEHNTQADYADFAGEPSPTQLDWYPDFAAGTYTGAFQGGWTITGNSTYLVVGGEFPTVNGVAQQGLVRFAIASHAPNKLGPRPSAALTPAASLPASNTVKLSWGTTWDPDNATLTYRVLRDSNPTPIATVSADSRFWNAPGPTLTFTDNTATAGRHTYRIQVVDPFGNAVTSGVSGAVTVTGPNIDIDSDAFNRNVSAGLGAANAGGAWTVGGPPASYSVADGVGTLRLVPGLGLTADLPSNRRTSTDLAATVNTDQVVSGGGFWTTMSGRWVSSGNEYRAKLHVTAADTLGLSLARAVNGIESAITGEVTIPGVTYAVGLPLDVRVEVTGADPTTISARAWVATSSEPTAWTVTATDATDGLQVAGAVGIGGYLSNLAVGPVNPTAPPALSGGAWAACMPTNGPPQSLTRSRCHHARDTRRGARGYRAGCLADDRHTRPATSGARADAPSVARGRFAASPGHCDPFPHRGLRALADVLGSRRCPSPQPRGQ